MFVINPGDVDHKGRRSTRQPVMESEPEPVLTRQSHS